MPKFKCYYLLIVLFLCLVFSTTGCFTITAPEAPTPGGSQSQDSSSRGQATPIINSFSASPGSIEQGESSTISWNVSGASAVTINQGIGDVGNEGSTTVAPGSTTMYMLTASNVSGSVTASTQIIVSGSPTPSPSPTPTPTPAALPDINFFTADPESITHGGSSMLSWNVANADSVSIDHGIGTVPPGGKQSVAPTVTTTYRLTATNAQGVSTRTAQITVNPAQAIIPPSLAPVGQPDLVILTMFRELGPPKYWHYTVKNQGSVEAGQSMSQLKIDGIVRHIQVISPLTAGESRHMEVEYIFACTSGTPHTFTVEVDWHNDIAESVESNNSRSVTFTCP